MFGRDPSVISRNFDTTGSFIAQLQATVPRRKEAARSNYVWDDVSGDTIAGFLDAFETHPGATKAQARVMARYVRSRLSLDEPELSRWTVALISAPTKEEDEEQIGGLSVGLTTRAAFPADREMDRGVRDQATREPSGRNDRPFRRRIQTGSRADAKAVGAGPYPIQARGASEDSLGPSIRHARPSTRGLLLIYPLDPSKAGLGAGNRPIIGLAVSFPYSSSLDAIDYRINNTYWEQELSLE